jgi:type II secretory pathway component PulL
MSKKEGADIVQEMRGAYSSIFPGEKKIIDELYQLKSHIREIGEKNDALTGVSTLPFLLDLSKRMESHVVYNDIQIEKGLVKLKGEARSTDDLTKIKTKLSEFLSDVSVSDVKPTAQGKILFTVVAKGT